jgi:hypothetical protein
MASTILAYCGITCTTCDAYAATQADDPAALAQAAASWREEFNVDVTAETIRCDGCSTDGPTLCSACSDCPVRVCARERGVANCGHCPDYPDRGCDTIEAFLSHAAGLRAVLDEIKEAREHDNARQI